HLSKIDGLR
ncbi:pyridoxal-phosphate dependent enzyme family protein, partial [Vibrio parahaemolyticus V-223/04]